MIVPEVIDEEMYNVIMVISRFLGKWKGIDNIFAPSTTKELSRHNQFCYKDKIIFNISKDLDGWYIECNKVKWYVHNFIEILRALENVYTETNLKIINDIIMKLYELESE